MSSLHAVPLPARSELTIHSAGDLEWWPLRTVHSTAMHNVTEWKLPVEAFLADLGRWIFQRTPFEYALIGCEVTPDPTLASRTEGR